MTTTLPPVLWIGIILGSNAFNILIYIGNAINKRKDPEAKKASYIFAANGILMCFGLSLSLHGIYWFCWLPLLFDISIPYALFKIITMKKR